MIAVALLATADGDSSRLNALAGLLAVAGIAVASALADC